MRSACIEQEYNGQLHGLHTDGYVAGKRAGSWLFVNWLVLLCFFLF